MMKAKERLETAEKVIQEAKRLGAQACAVRLSAYRDVDVQIRQGKLEELQDSQGRSLVLDLYVDGRYSSHSTSRLDTPSLKPFVQNAVALTRYLSPDEFRRLPEPELTQTPEGVDLQLVDPAHSGLETPHRIELARRAEQAALAEKAPIISVTSSFSDSSLERTLLHSTGLHREQASTWHSLSAATTIKDGERGRPEAYSQAGVRHLKALPEPEIIGREATRRARERAGQGKLPSGAYDLVVENRVASRLLSALLSPMSARSLQQKNSFLEGKLEQAIASKRLTVIDDPLVPKAPGSRLCDGEGLTSRRRVLVQEGLLKTYLMDNYYGRKMGQKPTGGDFSNILLEGGSGSLESLLKTLDRGIFITGFIGGNSNPSTGDFSFGISGFLVEKGGVVRPINEMNLTGNLISFWGHLEALAADPYPYSSWQLPSLLFRGTQLSGA